MAGFIGVLTDVDKDGNEQELYPVTLMEAVSGLLNEFADVRKEAAEGVNTAKQELQKETKEYTDSKHFSFNATINAGWSGSAAPYTNSISDNRILESDNPHVWPVYSEDLTTAVAQMEAWNMVSRGKPSAGKITFYCFEDKPTVAIPIKVEVNR